LNRTLLIGAIALGLVVDVLGTRALIARERAVLLEGFAQDRLDLVLGAAVEVEGQLHGVVRDLDFIAHLVEVADSERGLVTSIGALVRSVRYYRGAAVISGDGALTFVSDPLLASGISEDERALLLRTATAARDAAPGGVRTSPVSGAPGGGWYRAMAARRDVGGRRLAFGLLVDTRPLLMDLRLFAPEQSARASQLLVLGPHGRPAPATSPALLASLGQDAPTKPGARALLARMQRSERGFVMLPPEEAAALGLDPEPVVAAFAPVTVVPGSSWSIAILTSTSVLHAEEDSLVRREVFLALALSLGLVLIGGYVLVSTRRAAILRERLRAASEFARLRERAQEVLDHIPTGVLVLGDDGRVASANRALVARLGRLRADAPLTELFPSARGGARRIADLVEEARRCGHVASAFGERLDLFGAEAHFTVHAVPLAPGAGDAGVLVVLEDVSAVRSLEAQLLRAEKLATVGVLAAGIAHEIGTPLGVVRGRAEYLLDKLGEGHPQADKARVIVDQIDRVARTIRELLDFSRLRTGPLGEVRLEAVVARVDELLAYEAQRRDLRVAYRIEPGLPTLAADPDQLQQVLVNLVLNAFDASRPGATVEVVARPEAASDRVRVEVVDTGAGIPPELVHRVFDPFFTTKKRGQGTGLGLTIVGHVVRTHDAGIELQSVPTGGTRVVLSWPAHGSSPAMEAARV
jgi:signal transduction histidine kinase